VEDAYPPGLHMRPARKAGGRTVPILILANETLMDSAAIVAHCDRAAAPQRRLYPEDEHARRDVLAVEQACDAELGVAARALADERRLAALDGRPRKTFAALERHLAGEVAVGIGGGPQHQPLTAVLEQVHEAGMHGAGVREQADDRGEHLGVTVSLSLARSQSWAELAESGFVSEAAHAAAARCADLMRTMTHRLIGVGLMLQAAERLAEGPLTGRLSQAVAELDAIIRETRTAAFEPGALPGSAVSPRR